MSTADQTVQFHTLECEDGDELRKFFTEHAPILPQSGDDWESEEGRLANGRIRLIVYQRRVTNVGRRLSAGSPAVSLGLQPDQAIGEYTHCIIDVASLVLATTSTKFGARASRVSDVLEHAGWPLPVRVVRVTNTSDIDRLRTAKQVRKIKLQLAGTPAQFKSDKKDVVNQFVRLVGEANGYVATIEISVAREQEQSLSAAMVDSAARFWLDRNTEVRRMTASVRAQEDAASEMLDFTGMAAKASIVVNQSESHEADSADCFLKLNAKLDEFLNHWTPDAT